MKERGECVTDEDDLKWAGKEYERLYGGAEFYDLALEIIEKYPLQAAIIILATWNTGRFRFKGNNAQSLVELRKAIEECKPLLAKLKSEQFQITDFDNIGDSVRQLYQKFSKIESVKYTGASKVLHLFNPRLFLIWDTAMRDYYDYSGSDANDYLKYHKLLQKKTQAIKWIAKDKTLPKAIDEYHFITIKEKRKPPAD